MDKFQTYALKNVIKSNLIQRIVAVTKYFNIFFCFKISIGTNIDLFDDDDK